MASRRYQPAFFRAGDGVAGLIATTQVRAGANAARYSRQAALPAAAAALAASVLLGVTVGPIGIAPRDVISVILEHVAGLDSSVSASTDAIVWQIRLPRVILAGLVGATLALCGACYQGVFRNPLADPYLLGVASGAGLAQTAALVAGVPLVIAGFSLLTLAGFGGAVSSMLLAYSIARVNGRAPVTTLILAGAALSAINVAGISYLLLVSEENTRTILAWLLGGLSNSAWREAGFILPYCLPASRPTACRPRSQSTPTAGSSTSYSSTSRRASSSALTWSARSCCSFLSRRWRPRRLCL
jgi:iron complex transport system permease protein